MDLAKKRDCETYLLEHESDHSGESEGQDIRTCRQRPANPFWTWLRTSATFLIILTLLVYIAVVLSVLAVSRVAILMSGQLSSKERFTLPRDALLYEERPEWTEIADPWLHPATNELDAAWNKILFGQNIRVSPSEMETLHENTTNRVRVAGPPGSYAGALGVYHHLHCLNTIRMALSWVHYAPRLQGTSLENFTPGHLAHCVDALRQAVMCHANTAVYTTEWVGDSSGPMHGTEVRSDSVTTCVRWESIDGWARQRVLQPGNFTYVAGPFEKKKGGQ